MTKRTAARAKSPGNKKRRTGDKEDEDEDQPLPQVEKPTTPGKETWKEVLTPAAKEKASRGAAKKQVPRARGRDTQWLRRCFSGASGSRVQNRICANGEFSCPQ